MAYYQLAKSETSSKNWVNTLNSLKIQQKNYFSPQNSNLYTYATNNPVRYTDPTGLAAGEAFDSIEEAAEDWAKTYADDSIALNSELSSTIYSFKTREPGSWKKVTKYSYNVPKRGGVKKSSPNEALEKGQKAVSIIHSHGSIIPGYDDDDPSETDIAGAKEKQWKEFVVTPYGNLKSYDGEGNVEVLLSDLKKDGCLLEDGSMSWTDNPNLKQNYRYKKDKWIY